MLALEIVTDALRNIGVIAETETPSAEQGSDGVRKLNELMASLAEDGVDVGFAPISDTSDTVVIPLGDVRTIKALLAINMAPIYGAEIPEVVASIATSGYSRMLRNALLLAQHPVDLCTVSSGTGSSYEYDVERGY